MCTLWKMPCVRAWKVAWKVGGCGGRLGGCFEVGGMLRGGLGAASFLLAFSFVAEGGTRAASGVSTRKAHMGSSTACWGMGSTRSLSMCGVLSLTLQERSLNRLLCQNHITAGVSVATRCLVVC